MAQKSTRAAGEPDKKQGAGPKALRSDAKQGFWRRLRPADIAFLIVSVGLAAISLAQADIFATKIASDVRVSNVYVAPGVDLDQERAEQIIGNRQLVLVFLKGDLGDRGNGVCEQVRTAASGSLVTVLGQDLDTYSCALYPDADKEDFGRAFVSEMVIDSGVPPLVDRPIDAVKVMAYNFDSLVDSGNAPQEARTITNPVSRYLIAGIAIGMVVLMVLVSYLRGRRLGHAQADSIEAANRARGRLAERDMLLAGVGRRILELDEAYARRGGAPKNPSAAHNEFVEQFTTMMTTYRDLNEAAAADDPSDADLRDQIAQAKALREIAMGLEVP